MLLAFVSGTLATQHPFGDGGPFLLLLLRGIIVNRIYGTHKNLYIHLFSLTIFGPIYYGPP